MKLYPTILLAAVLLFAGCATQPKEHMAAVRTAGVSPELVHKLAHWGVLSPKDLIELHHRHVNDAVALRQLDRVGVNYVVDKSILKQLRKAGVSTIVIDALAVAGRMFEIQFRHPYGLGWHGPWGYPYGAYYYDDYGPGWPYGPYGHGPGFRGGPGGGPGGRGGPGGGGPGGGGPGGGGPGGGGPGGGGGGPGGPGR